MKSIDDLQNSLVAIIDQDDNVTGSGYVIRNDGYIVTCHHVIFTLDSIRIKYKANVYKAIWDESLSRPNQDIAVLKVNNDFKCSSKILFESKDGEQCTLLGCSAGRNNIINTKSIEGKNIRKGVDVNIVSTLSLYSGVNIGPNRKSWNFMPIDESTYKSYKVNCGVKSGFSGGLAISDELGAVIGIIQSSKDNETSVIRWENILDVIDNLGVDLLNNKQQKFEIPEYVINRKEVIKNIKEKIFDNYENRYSKVVVLHGFGGYGKTILAKCICNDKDVVRFFRDGIHYEVFGRENTDDKSIGDLLKRLIHKISGVKDESDYLDVLESKLIDVIGNQHVLIFLDDVWSGIQLKPFFNGLKNCVILVTTRNKSVFRHAKNRVEIQGMDLKQAYKLLTYSIDIAISDNEKILLERLCEKFGFWPQLLSIINRWLFGYIMMNPKNSIYNALQLFDGLLIEKGFTAFDPDEQSQKKRECAIRTCVDISLEDIGSNRNRLYELAVFSGDYKISLDHVALMWKMTAGLSAAGSEDLCVRLYNKSLISSMSVGDRYIVLHDNIMEYIISDLERNEGFLKAANNALIEGFCYKYGNNLLEVPEYEVNIWKNIIKYYVRSGDNDSALKLLKNFLWLSRKISILNIYELLDDYLSVSLDCVAKSIYEALLLSKDIISQYPSELSDQLWGRLAYDRRSDVKLFLGDVRREIKNKQISMAFPSLTPPGLEKFRLSGHKDRVNLSIYCDLDKCKTIITSSDDKTIRIWDANFGLYKNALSGHEDGVTILVCSNNGYQIVSGSNDNSVIIYNILTGEKKKISHHRDVVKAIKIAKNDSLFITASVDGTSYVCSAESGEIIWKLDDNVVSVNDICISSDDKIAVTVSSDNNGRVWDLSTGKKLSELVGHNGAVNKVIITPDNKKIITVSNDSTVRIWCMSTGSQMHVFERHTKSINYIDCSISGKYFVTSSDDNTAILWDLRNLKVINVLKEHTYPVNVVRFSKDEKYIITASSDNRACLWNVEKARRYSVLRGHNGEVLDANFSGDSLHVLTASSDNSARVWCVSKPNNYRRINSHHQKKN